MFDNPFAFIRWIAILSGIAFVIYRFQLLQELINIFSKKKNANEEIQNKVDEFLDRKRKQPNRNDTNKN